MQDSNKRHKWSSSMLTNLLMIVSDTVVAVLAAITSPFPKNCPTLILAAIPTPKPGSKKTHRQIKVLEMEMARLLNVLIYKYTYKLHSTMNKSV